MKDPRAIAEPEHVFIGDVQGCADELSELLGRVRDQLGSDYRLHFVGDLVNRGPKNLEVLERVRDEVEAGRAVCVLGNHEISLLMVAWGLRPLGERDSIGDVLGSREQSEWIEWLRRRPLAECGEIAGQPFAMVHASVHPDWRIADLVEAAGRVESRLAAADIDAAIALLRGQGRAARGDLDVLGRLTRCRSVEDDTWSSGEPGAALRAWHQVWCEQAHDYGVVYGHWSMQGLHVASGLRGLDTGCVHHGRGREGYLTAWLPDARQPLFGVPDDSFLQIPARRRYYRF